MSITLQHGGISIEIIDGPYLSNGQATPEAISHYTSLVVSIDTLSSTPHKSFCLFTTTSGSTKRSAS